MTTEQTISFVAKLNVHLHSDDRDCEVKYGHVPVMSERHAWRIADALGLANWSQGQGGRFTEVWYSNKRKALCIRQGWDI